MLLKSTTGRGISSHRQDMFLHLGMYYSGIFIDLSIHTQLFLQDGAIKKKKKLHMAKPCTSLYLTAFCGRTLWRFLFSLSIKPQSFSGKGEAVGDQLISLLGEEEEEEEEAESRDSDVKSPDVSLTRRTFQVLIHSFILTCHGHLLNYTRV